MNRNSNSQLASATAALLLFIGLLLHFTPAWGQDRFICKIGATMDEVMEVRDQFPYIHQTATFESLTLSCPEFQAIYAFDAGRLSQMLIQREYPNQRIANNSLEVHLLFIERSGATVQLMHADKRERVYSAVLEDSAYELAMRNGEHGKPLLQIRSWSREEAASSMELLGTLEPISLVPHP